MCLRILWFLLPGVVLPLKGEPLSAGTRHVRRLEGDGIVLTPDEIVEITAEIKELQSWDAVKAKHQGNEHEMFKRVTFRNEYVVLPTLRKIQAEYNLHIVVPRLEEIPGSRTATSDFDVAIRVPKYRRDSRDDAVTAKWKFEESLAHLDDDVRAASLFAHIIKEKFGGFSGTIFDSNIYVRDLPGGKFRETSSFIRATQDIAALTKVRRYTTAAEFRSIVERMDEVANNKRLSPHAPHARQRKQVNRERQRYEASKTNFQVADEKTMEFAKLLFNKLRTLEEGSAARTQQFQEAGSNIDTIFPFLRDANKNLVLEAEYALYLEALAEVRAKEIQLERIKRYPPRETNADIQRAAKLEWRARKQALRDEISGLIADGVYFAPEAYSSEGAFGHIVKYGQAKLGAEGACVFAALTPLDLLCSMNEQAGDFSKDVNFHYKDKPATALYQSSKYLMRFYDAIDLLDRKLTDWGKSGEWDPVHVGDIQTAIGPLYQIRKKSATESAKRREAGALVGADSALGSVLGTNVEEISKTLLDHLAKVNAEYRSNFGATWRGEPIPALGDTISVDTTWTEEPNSQPDDSGFHDGSDFDDEDPVTLRLKPDDTPPLATRKRKSGSSQISVKSLADLYEELEQSKCVIVG
eukprot:GEMP01013656.1.p1 GENE.GEMP01013656.1~~GEMP01013656.1.p1  ORF type:complete len:638 (+),score=139.44 GEMP01013656.1:128-2041(+)